jgi:hypothetical protein
MEITWVSDINEVLDKVLLPLETQKTETQQKSKVRIKEKEQVKPQVAIA